MGRSIWHRRCPHTRHQTAQRRPAAFHKWRPTCRYALYTLGRGGRVARSARCVPGQWRVALLGGRVQTRVGQI
eukprot:5911839-Prymnesium_polylepis.1